MKVWHQNKEEDQEIENNSFIGGYPKLPKEFEIPITDDTTTQMTFYFQYEFPEEHIYSGFILSVFATSDFMHEDYTIPEMLTGTLKGINVPKDFLDDYQKYFKVYVYKKGDYSLREGYNLKLKYKKLITSVKVGDENISWFADVNEKPNWYLDDESPSTYNFQEPFVFILQIKEGYEFEKKDNIPRQKVLGGTDGLTLCDSYGDEYELFNMNEIYFFGTNNQNKKVYIITQC